MDATLELKHFLTHSLDIDKKNQDVERNKEISKQFQGDEWAVQPHCLCPSVRGSPWPPESVENADQRVKEPPGQTLPSGEMGDDSSWALHLLRSWEA